jgi:aspartyl/glutamyl-tRNA(Asn/Gln) amidotransferase C subunit
MIMAKVGIEELIRAAAVAKVEVEEVEFERLHERFTSYLQWLEPLLQLDCAACEPQLLGHGAINVLREDRAEQNEILDLGDYAANFEEGFYVVPPIIE